MTPGDQIAHIKNALAVLQPSVLEVTDESHKHEGHDEWKDGILTHVHVKIAAPVLEGQSRMAQHRAVMDVLSPFLKTSLHSARITIIGCK